MVADYLPSLYVAALYGVSRWVAARGNHRQGIVVDTLAVNWLLCELANQTIDYPRVVAAYIAIDVASALWLSYNVKGRVAGLAQMFYAALILWNGFFYFLEQFTPMTHWYGLSALSWAQLVVVVGGITRHDIAQVSRGAWSRLGLRRYLGFGNKKADE